MGLLTVMLTLSISQAVWVFLTAGNFLQLNNYNNAHLRGLLLATLLLPE